MTIYRDLVDWVHNMPKLRPLEADEAAYLSSCPEDDEEFENRAKEERLFHLQLHRWSQDKPELPSRVNTEKLTYQEAIKRVAPLTCPVGMRGGKIALIEVVKVISTAFEISPEIVSSAISTEIARLNSGKSKETPVDKWFQINSTAKP